MRIKRQKKFNKYLSFYSNNFGFRKPFQVLIDGTFCHQALQDKINIKDQLTKFLLGDVKLITTQCIILETEKLGPSLYGAMLIVKQFTVHKCGHEKKPISAHNCLKSMLTDGNQNRYILASQDRDLQRWTHRIPGIPLLYIFNRAPTLEQPAYASIQISKTNQTLNISDREQEILNKLKEKIGYVKTKPQEFKRRKKKKKGGPNPLSCLKKKKDKKK